MKQYKGNIEEHFENHKNYLSKISNRNSYEALDLKNICNIQYGYQILDDTSTLYRSSLICKQAYGLAENTLTDIKLRFIIAFNISDVKLSLISSYFFSKYMFRDEVFNFVDDAGWIATCNTDSNPSVFQIAKIIKTLANKDISFTSKGDIITKEGFMTKRNPNASMAIQLVLEKLNGQSFSKEKNDTHIFDEADNKWLKGFGYTLNQDPYNQSFMILEKLIQDKSNENLVSEEEDVIIGCPVQ
ncbi:hypothetical protein IPG37_03100 [bacterium]|nr:MAG: hypothetical protein IPG37_03100 [bacterium]